MQFDEILERNRSFTRERAPRALPPAEKMDLAVVACYDPRLDELLLPALGLAPGRAIVVRTAGALIQPQGGALRTLALATFMFGVTEIIVVGHTSCRMAAFDALAFIDAFRRRNVAREAFGQEDLRAWAGAIADPKRGVQQSVANILAATVLPKDLQVAGLLLDDASGALEVVVRPGEIPAAGGGAPITPSAPAPAAAPATQTPTTASPAPTAPGKPTMPQAATPTPSGDPLVVALADFVHTLESKAGLGEDLRRLRQELEQHQNPLVKFGLLESFIREAAANSKDVADAYTRLRNAVAGARRRWDPQEVIAQFLRVTRRP